MILANIEPNAALGRQIPVGTVEEFEGQCEFRGIERRIAETVGYMRERLNQSLRVPKLASMVGVSQSHFFALFKKQTGLAPMDFFTRMRMRRACELLDSTSLSVKEIAAALGYDDQFYFSRVFKSVNRVSPSEYRARKAESNDQNRKPKPVLEKFPAVYLPRLDPVGENQKRARVLIGGFQPAAPCVNTFQENCGESSTKPNQTFSVLR